MDQEVDVQDTDRSLHDELAGTGPRAFEDAEDVVDQPVLFDMDFTPPTLETDTNDAASSDDLRWSVRGSNFQSHHFNVLYEGLRPRKLFLSQLARYYENNQESSAMNLLTSGLHDVVIDRQYTYQADDPNITWQMGEVRWDYDIRVPNEMGLAAVLPNVNMEGVLNWVEWTLFISTTRRNWAYRGERKVLGYDPAGNMLYFGRTSTGADIYLSWMPLHALLTDDEQEPVEYTKKSTVMSPPLRNATWALVAYAMSKSHYQDIMLVTDYPDINDNEQFSAQCNVTDAAEHQLSVEQGHDLNVALRQWFAEWKQGWPEDYKKIPQLHNSILVAIPVKYGQNRRICDRATIDTDAARWADELDLTKIARMSMALAFHITAHVVERWDPVAVDILVGENPDGLFDSANAQTRRRIEDLGSVPLLNEDGSERHIFNADGRRIPRREAVLGENDRPLPILQNLALTHKLFPAEDGTYEDEDEADGEADGWVDRLLGVAPNPRPAYPNVRYYVYPQGFTKTVGQWQADGLILPLQKKLRAFVRDISELLAGPACIEGVKSQMYNNMAHAVRSRTRAHIAQRGMLTAASSGGWAQDDREKRQARNLQIQVDASLPHERLNAQIDGVEKTAQRAESVFRFHFARMQARFLRGDVFYRDVVFGLRDLMFDAEVTKAIREVSVVFRPDVYPRLLKYTSYPVTSLLKNIYKHNIRPAMDAGGNARPSPLDVEMIAVADRLLNFCHTGNPKVLSRTLFGRLTTLRAILDHGFPYIPDVLLTLGGTQGVKPHINAMAWPTFHGTSRPMVGSQRAQELTFSHAHFLRYVTQFRLAMMSLYPGLTHRHHLPPLEQRKRSLGDVVVEVFVDDGKETVKKQVMAEIGPVLEDPCHMGYPFAQERKRALNTWLDLRDPFSFGPGAQNFAWATRAVSESYAEVVQGLPPSVHTNWSLADFIENITRQASFATNYSFRAPIVPKGTLGPTLRVALGYMRQLDPSVPQDEADRDFKRVLLAVFTEYRIDFVPDAPVPQGGGAPSREPSIHAWTRLGAVDQGHDFVPGPGTHTTQEERAEAALLQTARQSAEGHVRASWNTQNVAIWEFHGYLSRACAPDNFKPMTAVDREKNEKIKETYKWAETRINTAPTDPLCHLALILAFLISKMVPEVSWPKDFTLDNTILTANGDPLASIAAVRRQVKWTSRASKGAKYGVRKGTSDESGYFSCAAVVFLAWIDPGSPLHAYWDTDAQFGTDWGNKHSAKFLHGINLVRMGIASTTGSRLTKALRYNDGYVVLPQRTLLETYQRLKDRLRAADGGAAVVLEIFGAEMVMKMRAKRQLVAGPDAPPPVVMLDPGPSTFNLGRRGRDDEEVEGPLNGEPPLNRTRAG